jgi:SPP1 gp7 family putative phage head morphogenesis protein
VTPAAGRPLDFEARRRILVAEAIVQDALRDTDGLWEPRAARLRELVARLERAAERGDPGAFGFLRVVDEAAHQAAAYAGDVAPLILQIADRVEQVATEDARVLAPGPVDPFAARPALVVTPLRARIFQTLTGIVTATTQAVQQAAVTAFGVAAGPREVARRLTQSFGTAPTRARLIARTEILHSYRVAALDRYAVNPAVTGWYWLASLDGRTCPLCWGMHGTIHPLAEPFGSHPACRCTPVPIVEGRPLPELGVDRFAALTLGQQREILGPGRLAAYRGGVGLDAMIAERQHPVFGLSRQLVPVRALAQRAA